MMQRNQTEKVYFGFEYDDDYDPCKSSDDITERDLNILLKEKACIQLEKNAEVINLPVAKQISEKKKEKNKETKNQVSEATKKQICKKPRNNPFFTNRLTFSTNLPPPPLNPPPQLLPTVKDSDSKEKICPKRGKKCKKKSEESKIKGEFNAVEILKERGALSKTNQGGSENEENQGEESQYRESKNEESQEGEEGEGSDYVNRKKKKTNEGPEVQKRMKRKEVCKKAERRPCRKVSNISIALQPRQIPVKQKDLPATSPMNISEVKRQILISCKENSRSGHGKKKCRKTLTD